jgi:hypothetical protein
MVSFAFPPHNVIGAVRVGKLAKYLTRFGHDVRVLSALDAPYPKGLPLEIPIENVTYTPWTRVDSPLRAAVTLRQRIRMQGRSRPTRNGNGTAAAPTHSAVARSWLAERYQDVVCIPDENIGWLPSAAAAGRRIAREFLPQVIFASGKPWTSLVVANRVAGSSGVPWVAEFRDPWGGNPYDRSSSRLRQRFDEWFSRRVASTASGVVTVTPPLADIYEKKYGKPAAVVMSGYDEEDQPAVTASNGLRSDDRLWIAHTGSVYAYRDFTQLVRAMHRLGERAKKMRVSLVGADPEGVEAALNLATTLGVRDLFEVSEPVSRAESLHVQRSADVLLLATWNDPREHSFLPGKLFEYVGARRPILLLGLVSGAAAQLVSSRSLGIALDDTDAIAAWLDARLAEKERSGRTAGPPEAGRRGLEFESQARLLEGFLERFAR